MRQGSGNNPSFTNGTNGLGYDGWQPGRPFGSVDNDNNSIRSSNSENRAPPSGQHSDNSSGPRINVIKDQGSTPPPVGGANRGGPNQHALKISGPAGVKQRTVADRNQSIAYAAQELQFKQWETANLRKNAAAAAHGRGAGHMRLNDVLQTIHRDWDFMAQETCVPVQVALQLSDPSSLGRANRLREFQDTRHNLEMALQAIVNEHHQGFNSSIGTYHSIMTSISNSQSKVRVLREKLVNAKRDLTSDRPEVKNLALESQRYEDMLQILSSIEQLRTVPEKLDARISEKRFLTAVDLLTESLNTMNKREMKEIGALQDIRRNLESQESSLAGILIEELHSHLYLKSPYCDSRWKSYHAMKENRVPGLVTEGQSLLSTGSGKREFQQFLETEDLDIDMVEDASRNIEAESLHYIRFLIESLHRLGHLSNALEEISQRLPVELNKVVDKTNNEVDARHSGSDRGKSQTYKDGKSIDACLSPNDPRVEVIHDLLYTLYSKFESILEGYRVIHDVVKAITRRSETTAASSMSGVFLEVWKLIQSEIRSLLHDYLTTNESKNTPNAPRSTYNSVNNILVASTTNKDRKKALFKLAGNDKSDSIAKVNQEDLQNILKANVPGLVQDFSRPIEEVVSEDPTTDGSATGRKLLIEPTVFNMSHLLSPSLAFLQMVKEIVPPGLGVAQSTFTSFLDDFLVNVFLPQLEDTLRDLSSQTTGDLDAFLQDPHWLTAAQRPVMKGTTAFFSLITAICRMLDSIPHDQAFSQLIVDLLSSYYEKCYEFFKESVIKDRTAHIATGHVPRHKKSAAWSQVIDLSDSLTTLLLEDNMEMLQKENAILLKLKGEKDLSYIDIITERKTIYTLCLLYNSMKWLAIKIMHLRRVSEQPETDSVRLDARSRTKRWTLIEQAQKQQSGRNSVYLPLTKDLVNAFDGVVNTFDKLANMVLFTLRIEARGHIMYHLTASLKYSNFCLENEPTEPDPAVMALNTDLTWFDEDISTILRSEEQAFINLGLDVFMDYVLINGAGLIKTMNSFGMEKMLLNILVLQQNLKNIISTAKLERSAGFYRLFKEGPQDLIKRAKGGSIGYTYDELKQLVTLWYSESMQSKGGREGSTQARRSLNNHLIELSELMWEK